MLVLDEENQADSPYVVASALAKVLEKEEFDLILTGTQSDDLGYAQTGVMLAELLGLPYATIVMRIEIDQVRKMVKA